MSRYLFLCLCFVLCAVPLRGYAAGDFDSLLQGIEKKEHGVERIVPEEQGSIDPALEVLKDPAAPVEEEAEPIPEAYLREAEAYRMECEGVAHLADHYDCNCLALQYLNQRIDAGPRLHKTAIIASIADTCGDATGAAGRLFMQCDATREGSIMLPSRVKKDVFCQCYANTYANLYRQYGKKPGSQTFVNLQTAAREHCSDPRRASLE